MDSNNQNADKLKDIPQNSNVNLEAINHRRVAPNSNQNTTTQHEQSPPIDNIDKLAIYKEKLRLYRIKKNIVHTSVTLIMLFIVGNGLIFALAERPTVSEIEKRELATFPVFTMESYLSGEFFKDLSIYYADTVPLRETFVNWGSTVKTAMGINTAPTFYGDVSIVVDDDDDDYDYTSSYTPSQSVASTSSDITSDDNTSDTVVEEDSVVEDDNSDTTSTTTSTSNTSSTATSDLINNTSSNSTSSADDEDDGLGGFQVITNGIIVDGIEMYGEAAGLMLFGGSKSLGTRYAQVINQYKTTLGSDVNVYDLVVPTASEYYLPSKYSQYSASQKSAIDHIYASLSSDVIAIDAYSALQAHQDEYIYFRTDHHWTQLGAYYAYTAFASALGFSYPTIDQFTEKTKEGYVGTLYGYTNDIRLQNSPEDFVYYLPNNINYTTHLYDYNSLNYLGETMLFHEYASGTNTYSMFLGGDNLHLKISTDVNNGRSIAVFKESYGNAFIPYLIHNFENVYVIDIRYFGGNAIDYIRQENITDVLFINYSFAANTGVQIDRIENLMYK